MGTVELTWGLRIRGREVTGDWGNYWVGDDEGVGFWGGLGNGFGEFTND